MKKEENFNKYVSCVYFNGIFTMGLLVSIVMYFNSMMPGANALFAVFFSLMNIILYSYFAKYYRMRQ